MIGENKEIKKLDLLERTFLISFLRNGNTENKVHIRQNNVIK